MSAVRNLLQCVIDSAGEHLLQSLDMTVDSNSYPEPMQRFPARVATLAFAALAACMPLRAQNKAEPGRFDFYLLDMPWGPEFCSIADVSAHCTPQRSFVLHGLWPQNNDGSYPVFCSKEPGPSNPAENLDITPDLQLLAHEWSKHGTCSAKGPGPYFEMARAAFISIRVPPLFDRITRKTTMSPGAILDLFYKANPQMPEGSLIVSCRERHFTAVEACFTTGLKPMPCLGLHSCAEPSVQIEPPAAAPQTN
ncbi:MAG TPA: ribonuclease T [Acidobacteriaceae bacterium]